MVDAGTGLRGSLSFPAITHFIQTKICDRKMFQIVHGGVILATGFEMLILQLPG